MKDRPGKYATRNFRTLDAKELMPSPGPLEKENISRKTVILVIAAGCVIALCLFVLTLFIHKGKTRAVTISPLKPRMLRIDADWMPQSTTGAET